MPRVVETKFYELKKEKKRKCSRMKNLTKTKNEKCPVTIKLGIKLKEKKKKNNEKKQLKNQKSGE